MRLRMITWERSGPAIFRDERNPGFYHEDERIRIGGGDERPRSDLEGDDIDVREVHFPETVCCPRRELALLLVSTELGGV